MSSASNVVCKKSIVLWCYFFKCAIFFFTLLELSWTSFVTKKNMLDLKMSQPHFEASVRMKLTLPKVGTWSPLGLLKTQSLIVGVKTPCIEVFFILLERSWSVNVQNGLAHKPFGHLQHKLWSKERSGVKLPVWLPTTKSRGLTRFWCVQVECDTLLKSSWGELQVCFRLHPNQRSKLGVISFQSPRSSNRDNFGTPPWESRDKKSFECTSRGQMQRILYGEGGGFPRFRVVMSQVNPCCPWLVPTPRLIQNVD
jgi:hypothetical protein